MPEGKWDEFKKGKNYDLIDLGRPAVFFLPAKKLSMKIGRLTVEEHLKRFLVCAFGAFTNTRISSFGFWKDQSQKIVYDECCIYEVSFVGKDKIPALLEEIARIAHVIGEECIYFKAGQYSSLIYPRISTADRKGR